RRWCAAKFDTNLRPEERTQNAVSAGLLASRWTRSRRPAEWTAQRKILKHFRKLQLELELRIWIGRSRRHFGRGVILTPMPVGGQCPRTAIPDPGALKRVGRAGIDVVMAWVRG